MKRPSILLVEDEVVIRLDFAESLRADGWQVMEAGTGEDAVSALKRASFDVVLTDVNLPGEVSGLDVARMVRQHSPEATVVVMSGHHVPAGDELSYFHAFLSKPVVDIAAVLRKLAKAPGK